ncbi:hypothetical protein GYMLUDRAFT_34602 [Collybiopsis luxurians FD-317 M1]|nr:hypothetical protein GYMLUDRAFT_34602 [Collybiopsis luxurians FD-317 M1]
MHALGQQNPSIQPHRAKGTLRSNTSSPSFNSTPPLTQSTSGSNYSSNSFASTSRSPPQFTTPPSRHSRGRIPPSAQQRNAIMGRSGTRYPAHLALGRTPLHRRGTSQTYEPFEDLLREAGYKETRIFTPETDRLTEARGSGSGSKSKVAGVVGFLSGFIPGSRSTSLREGSTEETKESPLISPTPSPKRGLGQGREKVNHHTPLVDDDATPRPQRTGGLLHLQVDNSVHYTHNNHSYTSIGQSNSSKRMPPPSLPLPHHSNTVLDSRPSRATAYLRHIASVPDVPSVDLQRSQTLPANNRRRRPKRKSGNNGRYSDDEEDDDFNSVYEGRTRGNGEGEEDTNLPRQVPRSWLETVAKTMLFGASTSSLISGPAASSRAVSQPHPNNGIQQEVSPALRQLRQTRSVISRTGSLADAPRTAVHSSHRGYHHHHHNHNLTRTRSARSALSSRSGLSDRTNRSHWNWASTNPSPLAALNSANMSSSIGLGNDAGSRPRPMLMSRLEGSSRSNASETEIWRAKVMCRSAPASRAASPNPNTFSSGFGGRSGSMRGKNGRGYTEDLDRGRRKTMKGKGKEDKSKSKSKSKSRQAAGEEPPSLSRVMIVVEADGEDNVDRWFLSSPRQQQPSQNHRSEVWSERSKENGYLNVSEWDSNHSPPLPSSSHSDPNPGTASYLISSYSISASSGDEVEESEEEEESSENEVDLAKMLRPKPQRQQSVSSMRSVRSLRKFIQSPTDEIPPVPPLPPHLNLTSDSSRSRNSTASGSITGRWSVDGAGSYADRYGSKKGKRASLPSGWIGTDVDG